MTTEKMGAPATRLTVAQRDALRSSDGWQDKANRAARAFAPKIYPCGACGEPVVDGFCCGECGDPDPKRLAESSNG